MNNGHYDAAANVSFDGKGNPITYARGQLISESDPRWNDIEAYFSGIAQGDDGKDGKSLNSLIDNYLLSHGFSAQQQYARDIVAKKMGFVRNPNGGEGMWNPED